MNSNYKREDGSEFRTLVQKVNNLELEDELLKFLKGSTRELDILGTVKQSNMIDNQIGGGFRE